MKKNVLLLIWLICLCTCCSSSAQKKEQVKSTESPVKSVFIDLPKTGENRLNVSEFADTIMYVPLETNSKSFLRGIVQLQLTDQYLFINGFDRLFMFSKDGKFIRQIGRNGKGPGEYANIFGFAVNKDTIFITSTGKQSVIKYTVKGDFVEEQPTTTQLARFNITPDNSIIWYDHGKGNLVFFDRKFQKADTIAVDYNVSSERFTYSWWDGFDTFFHKGDHRLLFSNYMSDTIWDISNGKKEIGYVMNLGKQLLPQKYQIEYSQGDFERFKKNAAPYQKINLFETPSFLFLFQKGWIDREINSTYLKDRTSNTVRKFEDPSVYDDLVGMQKLTPEFTTNNCIIATISPTHLIEGLKKGQKTGEKTPSPLFLQQMAKVKENDNPILVIMPVKQKMKKDN
jgi:hypothetical protein